MCPRQVVLLPQAAYVCLPSATFLKSTLVEVFILNSLNPFRINTCRAKPHFAQFWCNISPFRINTCKGNNILDKSNGLCYDLACEERHERQTKNSQASHSIL